MLNLLLTLADACWTIFLILLLFGITIFVHELGHFLAARWMGLIVETFSIGFGPAIWKRTIKGITYKIGCLPFGGYVALPQLDPELGDMDEEERKKREAMPKVAPWRRMPVLLAGVTGNLILGIVLASVIYLASDVAGSVTVDPEKRTVIGYVSTNSAAYEHGVRKGQKILEVNGEAIDNWNGFILRATLGEQADLTLKRPDGEIVNITVPTERIRNGARTVMGMHKVFPPMVREVSSGTSAEKAGLKPGDIILELDGEPILCINHLQDVVIQHRNQDVPVVVLRKDVRLTFKVTPTPQMVDDYDKEGNKVKKERVLIGITFCPFEIDFSSTPGWHIYDWGMPVFRMLRALMTPKEAKHVAVAVSGPVGILSIMWLFLHVSVLHTLWLVGLLNINLAILNMLPVPILDGGHIIFTLVEMIRGKPLNSKFLYILYNIFFVLLIILMILVTFKDVKDLFFSRSKPKPGDANVAEVRTNASAPATNVSTNVLAP